MGVSLFITPVTERYIDIGIVNQVSGALQKSAVLHNRVMVLLLGAFLFLFANFAYSDSRNTIADSSKTETSSKKVITLWHAQGSNESFWQEATKEFHRTHPNVQIEMSLLPRKELNSTLTFSVLTNESPDMVLIQSDLLGLKSLFRLDVVPDSWIKKSIPKNVLDYVMLGNKIYGIPMSYGNHLVMYYNKSLVKKPAETWEEILEQSKSLPDGVNALGLNYRSTYSFIAFWHVFGDQIVVDDRANIKNQNTVDALTFYKEIARKRIVDASCNYSCVTADFYAGKYAYSINGDWDYVNAKRELGENLGIAMLPKINGKRLSSLKSTLVLAFPNGATESANYKHLRDFAGFVQSKAFLREVNIKLNRQPAHLELQEELKNTPDPDYQALLQQLELSVPMPTSVAMITAWDSIHKGFRLFIDDGVSPETATAYMQKKANYELKKVLKRDAQ